MVLSSGADVSGPGMKAKNTFEQLSVAKTVGSPHIAVSSK